MQFSLHEKETLYHELAQLLAGGFSLPDAARLALESGVSGASRRLLIGVAKALQRGDPPGSAFQSASPRLSNLEYTLIEAGALSGKLEATFRDLSEYFAGLEAARKKTLSKLAYPIFMLHLGPLILAVPDFFLDSSRAPAALLKVGYFLGGVYAVALVIYLVAKTMLRIAETSQIVDGMLRSIPILRTLRKGNALYRFCRSLDLQLEAAIPLPAALQRSGDASGSALLLRGARQATKRIHKGSTLGESLQSPFPKDFRRSLLLAEKTGALDAELRKWAEYSRLRALSALDVLATWLPKILYFGLLLYLGWRIISLYQAYLAGLMSALDNL